MKNKLFVKQIKLAAIIFTSFIIFCSSLLILGCPSPFGPDLNTGYRLSNVGTVRLYIAGSEPHSRTIMPVETNNSIVWYRLQFGSALTINRKSSELSLPIELSAGSYTLTVNAYTSDFETDMDKPAATGSVGITVTAGQTVTAEIDLKPIIATGGTGVFSWNINYNIAGLTGIEMDIQNLSGTSVRKLTFTTGSVTNSTSTESLDSGYYRVVFTLNRTNSRPVIWRETLHVYQSMTSHYAYSFTAEHFIMASYDVTFNYNYVGSPMESTNTWFYNEDYSYKIAGEPAAPVRPNWRFGGWYNNAAVTGTPWNFSTHLTDDLKLWAKWDGVPVLTRSPTTPISFSQALGAPLPGAQTITINNTGTAAATGITITNSNTSQFNLVSSITTIAAGSNATFTIAPTGTFVVGNYSATITISYTGGTDITIPVTLTVGSKWQGTQSTDVLLNSNSLLNIPAATYGWYAKTVANGTWKQLGTMRVTNESRTVEAQMTEVSAPFNSWGDIYRQGTLVGDIGTYKVWGNGSGQDVRIYFDINVQIPYDYLVVYAHRNDPPTNTMSQQSTTPAIPGLPAEYANFDRRVWYRTEANTNISYQANNTGGAGAQNVPTPTGTPYVRLESGSGGTAWFIKMLLLAKASVVYTETLYDYELQHPVFEAGGIYYWQTRDRCTHGSGCNLRACIDDHWSIEEEISIINFNPLAHNSTGNIQIRAYDPADPAATFVTADPAYIAANGTSGLDILMTTFNSSYYTTATPLPIPIVVDGENVGTATVKIVNHQLSGGDTGILQRVQLQVDYSFNPSFESSLDSFTCNGVNVPLATKTITLPFVNHGPLALHHVFTFKDE